VTEPLPLQLWMKLWTNRLLTHGLELDQWTKDTWTLKNKININQLKEKTKINNK